VRRATGAARAAVLLPRVAVDHAAGVAEVAVDHAAVAVAGVEDVGKQEVEDDDKDEHHKVKAEVKVKVKVKF